MKKTNFLLTFLIIAISIKMIASQIHENDLSFATLSGELTNIKHASYLENTGIKSSSFLMGDESTPLQSMMPRIDLRSLIADFSADLTLLPVTNSVNFTDLSTGTITTWTWSFPGGTPATYVGHIPPPIYYNTAGSYDVTLSVSDGVETISTTKTAYINVVNYPDGWSFTRTATSHLVSVATNISFSTPLQAGDFIGAFYLDENNIERCGGANVWDGVHNKVVVAFGDDATTTPLKEGFAAAENFVWKVFFTATSNVKNASVSYNAALPNSDGKFADNGLSALTVVNTNPLEIDATATPGSICGSGTQVQLNVNVIGGTGTYTYSWTSSPAGFTSTLKNPVHTPTQTTTYSVSVNDGTTSVSDNVTVTVSGQATASAGADATICQTGAKTLGGSATNYSSTLWSSSGDGTFNNATVLIATYTPGANDILNGTVTLTLTANPNSPCVNVASDYMILTIRKSPVSNAGDDATICQTSTHTLSGSAQNNSSVTWSTSGNGTFSSTSSLTPVYTPGTTDISAGTVNLTLSAAAVSPCTIAATDTKILVIQKSPTANAGTDATVCEGSTHQLSGSAQYYETVAWASSGDGSFSNSAIINPIYTPGNTDIANGTVTLTLTSSAISPCSTSTTDSKILVIRKAPTVNAGTDATACQSGTHQLSGTAQNHSSVLWTTSGNGTFSNASILSPVYTPGSTDATNGTVTLTLTANALSPCTGSVSDSKIVIIQKSPVANAGTDASVCQGNTHQLAGTAQNNVSVTWSSTGNGTFSSNSILDPVYTPGSADLYLGTVTLTLSASAISPCTVAGTDTKTLKVQKNPTANAGSDATICQTGTHQLVGTSQNYGGFLWTTSGDGSFSSPTISSPIYTPGAGDIFAGTVNLTFTVQPISPCEVAATDSKTLVIRKSPTANAGEDVASCGVTTLQLEGTAQNYGTILWASSGDGTYSSTTILDPIYNPGTNDVSTGTVTLTLTASAISPCSVSASDNLIITIQKSPEVFAGNDTIICENNSYELDEATSDNTNSINWTTTGDGSFEDALSLNTTYFPGPTDVLAGSVELCIYGDPIDPCLVPASDCLILDIQMMPTVFAGEDVTICQDGSYLLEGATASNFSSANWTGNVDDPQIVNAIYTPTQDDIDAGFAELCLTVEPKEPCTLAASDCLTITIIKSPTAFAGEDATICQGDAYYFADATAENYNFLQWYTINGGGFFDDETILNPTYYPSPAIDYPQGSVYLYINAQAIDPCTTSAEDNMTLTIQAPPQVYAGDDAIICATQSFTTNPTITNQASVYWTTSGDGYFDDPSQEFAIYYPGFNDLEKGSIELCVFVIGIEPCKIEVFDCMVLTFQPLPTVDAGFDATICEDGTYNLAATATSYSALLWSGNVDDPTSLNPVYIPTADDIAAGYAEICLTASSLNPCTDDVTDCVIITLQALPVVNAGSDVTIGEGYSYTIEDASANNYSSLLWASTGDGEFDGIDGLYPTYTPGNGDISSGTVDLCVTAQPLGPCELSAQDCMTITIELLPVANVGDDLTICENENITLSEVTASNYSSLLWATNGDGSFDDPTILNPKYTPGINDNTNGTVELCLTAQPISPATFVAEDCLMLNIQPLPSVNAGPDITICEENLANLEFANATNYSSVLWYTLNGSGTFSDNQILNPVYYPSWNDVQTGCVDLYLVASPLNPCTIPVPDSLQLCFQKQPTAFAGDNILVCESETIVLAQATAENYSSLYWGSSGDGVFDNAETLNPVYTAGTDDIDAGSVELTISAEPKDPCTFVATSSVVIFITKLPSVDAGGDLTINYNEATPEIQLNGSVSNSSSLIWSTAGDGIFDNQAIENPVYTPGTQDVIDGIVTLSLSAGSNLPCQETISDDVVITILSEPTAFAGNDATICEDGNYYLAEATASLYSSLSWTTNGDGSFDSPLSLNPTYTPGAGDIEAGTVELCLIAQPLSSLKGEVQDCMTLTIQSLPTAFAGNDFTVCEQETVFLSEATASNYAILTWFTANGTGSFNNNQIVNPEYYPSSSDIELGCVELSLMTSSVYPCNFDAHDIILVCFQKNPTVDAGGDASICDDESFTLAGATASNYNLLNWSSSGDGSFDDHSWLNPRYVAGVEDFNKGTVELTLTAQPMEPCYIDASSSMILSLAKNATAFAGNDLTVCETETVFLSEATASDYSEVSWFTTNGTGAFSNNQIVNPEYYPSSDDVMLGCVNLQLNAYPLNPCITVAEDIILVCFQKNPTVDAGGDASICEDESFTLAGATASNFILLNWSSSGDGSFDDPSLLNPRYFAGTYDFANGTVELTLNARPMEPCYIDASSSMILNLAKNATADAGNDLTVCLFEAGAEIQIDGTVTNSASILWTSTGDGSFNNNAIEDPIYYPGVFDFQAGNVTLTLDVESTQPCTVIASDQIIISLSMKQEIVIPSGWSGISSFIQPADANIETVMADVLSELIIMYNYENQIYYPAYNINTLNNWDYPNGYFIKLIGGKTLTICGTKGDNRTLLLNAGWNIIPVLSNQYVPVADVFGELGDVLTIVKEIAGYNIYYPEFGIYTLNSLASGKAYLVRVTEDCSITFPEVVNKSGIVNPPSNFDDLNIWGEIVPTPSSHQIIFPASVTSSLNQGDVIGAFSADGLCAGMLLIDGSESAGALTVYGDDAYSSASDGLMEGQMISFKLFKAETSVEFDFQLQFAETMNDGHFANNGISLVKAMNLLAVNEINTSVSPNIYPNPAKDIVNIGFNGISTVTFDVKMMNAFGEVVKNIKSAKTTTSLDVTGLSKGVYYLRISTGSEVFIEKLILQ